MKSSKITAGLCILSAVACSTLSGCATRNAQLLERSARQVVQADRADSGTTLANAAQPASPPMEIRSGTWLLGLCAPAPSEVSYDKAMRCLHYLEGVLDGYYATIVRQTIIFRAPQTLLCGELVMYLFEVRETVVTYIRAHPEAASQLARHAVISAMRERLPCPAAE